MSALLPPCTNRQTQFALHYIHEALFWQTETAQDVVYPDERFAAFKRKLTLEYFKNASECGMVLG